MKKSFRILINLVLCAVFLSVGFFLMGVYDPACSGSNYADIVFLDPTVALPTVTKEYDGNSITAYDVPYGEAAVITVQTQVTMQPGYDFNATYNASSATLAYDTVTGAAAQGAGITMSAISSDSGTNPIFSSSVVIPAGLTEGVYQMNIHFTINNTSAGRQVDQIRTIYLSTEKKPLATPDAPTLVSRTDTEITVAPIVGMEYSVSTQVTPAYSVDAMGSVGTPVFQDSNVFTGLTPNTGYQIVQRLKETATNRPSAASVALLVTTDKSTPAAPEMPTLASVTDSQASVGPIPGAEYSLDGASWQSSTEFAGLSPHTPYSIYARVKATENAYASPASAPQKFVTDKITKTPPSAPTPSSIGSDSVTLTTVAGMEYSMDLTTWQTSPSFTGLTPSTTYRFYQRSAETENSHASPASLSVAVLTAAAPTATPTAVPTVQTTDVLGTSRAVKTGEISTPFGIAGGALLLSFVLVTVTFAARKVHGRRSDEKID